MALETATYIDGLVATNPAASDAISTADDHLRLIKSTIKNTFTGITGPVTVTQAQLNDVVNKALQTDLTALSDDFDAAVAALTPYIIPSGGIIMWSGSVASIPGGWYLCNGSNGTPDLRDRFVIGAGSNYAVAATGGSKDAIVVAHSHTATSTSTVTDPGHFHGLSGSSGGGSQPLVGNSGTQTYSVSASATTGISVATSTTVASTGSSGTNANLPPYYALAFIMKA